MANPPPNDVRDKNEKQPINPGHCKPTPNDVRDKNEKQPINPGHCKHTPNDERNIMSVISPKSVSLPTIIRSFKSACTKTINQMFPKINFAWQERFHDYVVQDQYALYRIQKYICENPKKWQNDIFRK